MHLHFGKMLAMFQISRSYRRGAVSSDKRILRRASAPSTEASRWHCQAGFTQKDLLQLLIYHCIIMYYCRYTLSIIVDQHVMILLGPCWDISGRLSLINSRQVSCAGREVGDDGASRSIAGVQWRAWSIHTKQWCVLRCFTFNFFWYFLQFSQWVLPSTRSPLG